MIIVSNLPFADSKKNNNSQIIKENDNIESEKLISEKPQINEKNISQEINIEEKTRKEEENLPKVNTVDKQKIIEIRINNSFADANKKMKTDLENEINNLFEKVKKDSNLYSLIIDTEIGVVSPTNILFVCDSEASAELLNEKDNTIVEYFEIDKKIVFVDKEKWKVLVADFKNKTNNKIKYEYIEEPNIVEKSEIEDLANNIFGDDNIIVEE